MISIRVLDHDVESVSNQRYDISLFASGYESRCIHIPRLIDPGTIANPLVFGFMEESKSANRLRNDAFFFERWERVPTPLSSDDEKPIYDYLHKHTQSVKDRVHILLDYSSMSRLWYAAVLN